MTTGGFIYAIGAKGSPHVKIGKTRGAVEARLSVLQSGQPTLLFVLASVPVQQDLSRIEKAIHRFLETDRQRGEWFAVQMDQDQLEALIVRAEQWLAAEDAAGAARLRGTPTTQPSTIGERITQLRTRHKMSQKELAKRATVHHVVLNRLENGHKAGVHAETIRLLAVALDCSMDYLMGLTDDPHPRKRRRQADTQEDFWPAAEELVAP